MSANLALLAGVALAAAASLTGARPTLAQADGGAPNQGTRVATGRAGSRSRSSLSARVADVGTLRNILLNRRAGPYRRYRGRGTEVITISTPESDLASVSFGDLEDHFDYGDFIDELFEQAEADRLGRTDTAGWVAERMNTRLAATADFFAGLSFPLTVYRGLSLAEGDEPRLKDPGWHWTPDRAIAASFAAGTHHASTKGPDRQPILLRAVIESYNDVNWEESIQNYFRFSSEGGPTAERQITIPSDLVKAQVVAIGGQSGSRSGPYVYRQKTDEHRLMGEFEDPEAALSRVAYGPFGDEFYSSLGVEGPNSIEKRHAYLDRVNEIWRGLGVSPSDSVFAWSTLYVYPDLRGAGIGASVVRRVEGLVRGWSGKAIILHAGDFGYDPKDTLSVGFWKKMGYQEFPIEHPDWMEDRIMVKVFSPKGSKSRGAAATPKAKKQQPTEVTPAVAAEAASLASAVERAWERATLAGIEGYDTVMVAHWLPKKLLARKIGAGADRIVFRSAKDPRLVIKAANPWRRSANLDEASFWEDADPRLRELLVPVLGYHERGHWLVMPYVEPWSHRTQGEPDIEPFLAVGLMDMRDENLAKDGRALDYGEPVAVPQEHQAKAQPRFAPPTGGLTRG